MPRTTTSKAAAQAAADAETRAETRAETSRSTRSEVPAYDLFVPDSTKENYRQMARDTAASEGIAPAEALARLADGFDQQAEEDPTGGWGHLADWARAEGDPGDGAEGDLTAVERAKAVESAVRDPKAALTSNAEAVAAAEAELARRGRPAQADVIDGVVPNPGPAAGVGPSGAVEDDRDDDE